MKTLSCHLLSFLMLCTCYAKGATYPSTYDVVYDRISLSVNPGVSAAITSGTVTTWFKTTAAAMSEMGLDLDQAMNVTSVVYHGSTLAATAYSHTSNVLLINFPAAIAVSGTLDSITINYNGTPVTPTTTIPSGYNRAEHSSGNYIIYTLSESFTGHDWWPCKDSLVDKIDSVDLIVTAPSSYLVAGNGSMTSTVAGSNTITTWKMRYPIPTYLVNFAVANYEDYEFTVTTGLTTPTVLPIYNYLFPESYTAANETTLNVIQNLIPGYVSLLDLDYPYLTEKYGTAECANFGGALEVTTMTFVASGAYTTSILAHELSHQWFGDRLTTDDWHMIWLNEGFAEYFQYVVYPGLLESAAAALTSRQNLKSWVTNTSTTAVSSIANVDDIFIPSSSLNQPYEKGAMTLSMLRTWLGDSTFFHALHNYLTAPGLAYNFTSVDSLEYYMQAQVQGLGFNLSNFFNEWVNQQGRVTYAVNYQTVNNGIYINLLQSPTVSGAGNFDMPVPIEIQGAGLDTTVVIIDQGGVLYNSATGASFGGRTAHYTLSATPASLSFDPNSLVLATASSISPVTTLPLLDVSFSATAESSAVLLSWEVTTDETLQSFVIEKSSDGIHFTAIGSQDAVATGSDIYRGTYSDANAGAGVSYYRLKIIQADGSDSYSMISMVDLTGGNGVFKVWPNPAEESFTVEMPAGFSDGGPVSLTIYNSIGQLLQKEVITGESPVVSCGGLAPGAYAILLVNDQNRRLLGQFIKK